MTEVVASLLEFHTIALRTGKTLWSFDRSECNRVDNGKALLMEFLSFQLTLAHLNSVLVWF